MADAPSLAPGINAVGVCYDFAHDPKLTNLMTAVQGTSGKTVNRMVHIDETSSDLLTKLEAVRLLKEAHEAHPDWDEVEERLTQITDPS